MPTTAKREFVVVDLNPRDQKCHRCGKVCPVKFGLPVGVDGRYIPNWLDVDWAGVAACEPCYRWHEAWSERTKPKA